jgi:hypothetical protein
MNENLLISRLKDELETLDKKPASSEELKLFRDRIKTYTELESLARVRKHSWLGQLTPGSATLYSAIIGAVGLILGAGLTNLLLTTNYNNYFKTLSAQSIMSSPQSDRKAIADRLLILEKMGFLPLSEEAKKYIVGLSSDSPGRK